MAANMLVTALPRLRAGYLYKIYLLYCKVAVLSLSKRMKFQQMNIEIDKSSIYRYMLLWIKLPAEIKAQDRE